MMLAFIAVYVRWRLVGRVYVYGAFASVTHCHMLHVHVGSRYFYMSACRRYLYVLSICMYVVTKDRGRAPARM